MAADLSAARWTLVETPIGDLGVLVSELGVIATVNDASEARVASLEDGLGQPVDRDDVGLATIGDQVREYFRGHPGALSAPVDLRGFKTPFARRVLEQVRKIPPGETRTYGDVAEAAGAPRAARAAGSALAACPIELFVPCHRVVSSGPGIGGYGGAEERKAYLLRLEGVGIGPDVHTPVARR